MKKSITIPKIEEELYNSVKTKAEENNQSVSEYVSSLFEKSLNPDITEEKDNQSEEIQKLQEELESVKTENNSLHQENYDLTEQVKEKDSKIKALTEDCGKFDEQREQLKAEIKSLQENQPKSDSPNSVTLRFEDFDFAVLKYCLEKFNAETGKNFNESELLKYMFTEYAVKGSIYFFKTPGYFRLKEIQKQVEEQKQNHNNE
jgi:DNA repair exonuclease SbcCD ATPase subunit